MWIGYLDTARGYWNAYERRDATSRARATSKNTYTAGRWNYSWGGRYTPTGSGSGRTFTIEVNVQYLEDRAGCDLTTWILSTSTHELGHGLKLADNPSTTRVVAHEVRPRPGQDLQAAAYDVSEVVKYS